MVKSVPVSACAPTAPYSILQIAGTVDWEVPYKPGDAGSEWPPVTQQVASLEQRDGRAGAPTTTQAGTLILQDWTSCTDGTRVALATYAGGGHEWPQGDATTPGAASVIATFFGV